MKSPKDRIVLDSGILMGKPTIKGTRISVKTILDLMKEGLTREEIIAEYPSLTKEDIAAALSFAAAAIDFNEPQPYVRVSS